MLQTGVVDMDFLALDLFAAFKIQEQAKNLILVDAFTGNFIDVLINKKVLDSFPRNVQDILISAGLDVEMRVAKGEVPKWSAKVTKQFKELGVNFYQFPAAERAKWATLIEDIPAEWAAEVSEQGMPGWEIVKRYQEITAALGYEWPKQWGVKK
jgi:TRAP-type C4-dicarboxylate transport system substrate-binding protein